MEGSKLRLKALDLLANRPRTLTLAMIEQHTKLPESWLKSFLKRGNECDAGSDRVVILYEYLSRKELKI